MSDYNGWTNYETWAVKLWIDNSQGSQEYWLEQAKEASETASRPYMGRKRAAVHELAKRLKDEHVEGMLDINGIEGCVYHDLLSAALASVNWHEIAESLIDSEA